MKELRTLLPKEQEIVGKLAELKGNGENNNLQNYQAGRVLEQIVGFNFAAIKWDVNKQKPIDIFYEKSEERDKAFSSFFSLCDFLYLLEDLQKAGLIAIQSVLFDEERLLYNRNKHKKEEFDNWQFKKEQIGISYLVPDRGIQTYKIDIVDYLENYLHLKIIYPRPALFEYVANGFKTTEQKRHDDQMKTLQKELSNTRITLLITLLTLLFTAFSTSISFVKSHRDMTMHGVVNDSIKNKYEGSIPNDSKCDSSTIKSSNTIVTDTNLIKQFQQVRD